GKGIANSENLFVPFYTTKPAGSGVGLALAQQIARAHGGEISLRNREDGAGARAPVRLPLRHPANMD
ncbi:MAG: ATP-binding protein, partial [Terracidiphilus sp.]